ncbi:gas vesicle protein [Streptomyces sp. SCA3-4]|uniref:gas vesicle protein n=1 Tax=Streptomyces sichuanensis TaxID=2871810 RepID=UPI001CE2E795|nr:gas vesicle protein [Streptomyces sichuanensis]MCA6093260.1 gas vesicle protein [Streptomyces sichuanensis]
MTGPYADEDRPLAQRQVALIDLLDRLLSGGVVLTGDLVLSIADIDLVRISLRAVVVAIREQTEGQWDIPVPGDRPVEGGEDRAEPW